MICKECGNKYPDYFTYCPSDGHILGNKLTSITYKVNEYCTTCNVHNKEGYSYCSNCGTSMLQCVEKRGIQDTITKSILPEIKRSVTNVEVIKTKAKKLLRLNVKQDWKLFLPILIAIIAVLSLPTFILNSFLGNHDELSKDRLGLLLAPEKVSKDLSDLLNYQIDLPNFLNIFSLTNLLHGLKFNASFFNGYLQDERIYGTINNFPSAMIFIPILLLVSGIALGFIAKKYTLSLSTGIISSITIYTLFMILSSFLGSKEFSIDQPIHINASLTYSKIDALITSLLLSGIFVTLGALLAYHFQGYKKFIKSHTSLLRYTLSAFAITFIGVFINVSHTYLTTKNKSLFDNDDTYGLIKSLIYVPTGIIHFLMTQANTFKINLSVDNSMSKSFKFNWLFGTHTKPDENMMLDNFSQLLLTNSFDLTKFLLLLITIILISTSGYLLFNQHRLQWKEIVKLSGSFAIIQCLLLFLSNITINGYIDNGTANFFIGFSYISTLLTSFIFGGIFFYVGGYVKKYLINS